MSQFGAIASSGAWRPSAPNNGSTVQLVGWVSALEPADYVLSGLSVASVKNKVSGVLWSEVVNRPRFNPNAINGRPAFIGDGVAQRIITTEALPLTAFTAHQAFTVLIVSQTYAYANNPRILSACDSTGALHQQEFGHFDVNGGIFEASRKGAVFATRFETPHGAAALAPNIHAFTYDGTGFATVDGSATGAAVSHYLNRSPLVDSALGGDLNYDRDDITGVDQLALFCLGGSVPAGFFNGAIGEVLIYKGNIGAVHLANAQRFLAERWRLNAGVVSSPVRHLDTTYGPDGLWKFDGSLADSSGRGYTQTVDSGAVVYDRMAPGLTGVCLSSLRLTPGLGASFLRILGDMTVSALCILDGTSSLGQFEPWLAFTGGPLDTGSDINYLYCLYATTARTPGWLSEHDVGINDNYEPAIVLPRLGELFLFTVTRIANVIQCYLNDQPFGPPSDPLTPPTDGSASQLWVGGSGGVGITKFCPPMRMASLKITPFGLSPAQVAAEFARTGGPYSFTPPPPVIVDEESAPPPGIFPPSFPFLTS